MRFSKLTIFILCLISSKAFAQTFNSVEKSQKYQLHITNAPVDFEDEPIDAEEAQLYNKGHDEEIIDEYDLPEQIVDESRETFKEVINKKHLEKISQAKKEN